ncbi:MAG: hypothetical protein ABR902_15790 [Candidatus Korobacteraceae bacterium]|jgi:hypothetical protein
MVLWQQGVRYAAQRMPKVVGPATHAAFDYAFAGSLFVMAAWLWKRNRRAAVGSLICGSATAANAILTDHPVGALDLINYKTHARVDAALAALTAATPRLMGFANDDEARLFGVHALARTVVSSLTDFDE